MYVYIHMYTHTVDRLDSDLDRFRYCSSLLNMVDTWGRIKSINMAFPWAHDSLASGDILKQTEKEH